MPVNYIFIATALNTLQNRMFSAEFRELELFRDHPEWLTRLYTELSGMITATLSTAELEESEAMAEQINGQINALLNQVRLSSDINRRETNFAAFFSDIKNSFCPRFPIC